MYRYTNLSPASNPSFPSTVETVAYNSTVPSIVDETPESQDSMKKKCVHKKMPIVVNSTRTSAGCRNKFYKTDFSYDIKLNRFLLRLIGVWPTISRRSRLLSRFAISISVIFLIFFFVPQGCYVFLVEEDSLLRFRMFGPLSFTAMAMAKYAIALARHEGIESCIESIANDWRLADDTLCRPVMLRYARASRIFTKLYAAFMFGGVGFYSWILPFVNDRERSNSTARPLAYPSEFYVFDTQISPMYEIVFAGQSISMLVIVCTITCGICTIAVKFVIHACSRYEIVIAFVRSLDDYHHDDDNDCENVNNRKSREKFVKRRLAEIILRHLNAVEFVSQIEKVLNEICLVDLVGCTINICFLGYYLLMEWENSETIGLVTYFMLMMSFVSNIFVLCYAGEYLTEQCKQVGMAAYMTNWWRLPDAQARALILVIATAHLPVKFTAGKMVNLSLQTFGSVMKAAIAYLNALRAVM